MNRTDMQMRRAEQGRKLDVRRPAIKLMPRRRSSTSRRLPGDVEAERRTSPEAASMKV